MILYMKIKNKILILSGAIIVFLLAVIIMAYPQRKSGYTEDISTAFSWTKSLKLTSLFKSKCYYTYNSDIFASKFLTICGKVDSKVIEQIRTNTEFHKYAEPGGTIISNLLDIPPEWLEHSGIKKQGKHSYFLSADGGDEVIVITDKENGIFQQFKVSETTGGFVGRIMASNVRR